MLSSIFVLWVWLVTNLIGVVFALFIIALLFNITKDFVIDLVEMAWESLHESSYLAFKEKQAKKNKMKKSKTSQ